MTVSSIFLNPKYPPTRLLSNPWITTNDSLLPTHGFYASKHPYLWNKTITFMSKERFSVLLSNHLYYQKRDFGKSRGNGKGSQKENRLFRKQNLGKIELFKKWGSICMENIVFWIQTWEVFRGINLIWI